MAETYRVIDLSNICVGISPNIAFLILSDEEGNVDSVKKVRVKPRYLWSVKCRKDENIRIILKNSSTGVYDVLEVPLENGIYDIHDILKVKKSVAYSINYRVWNSWGKTYMKYAEKVTFNENAMVVHSDNQLSMKPIAMNATIIEGTNMMLKQVSYNKLLLELGEDLLNKCLQGEQITLFDFFPLVDNEVPGGFLNVELGDLQFEIKNEEVVINKLLAGQGCVQEKISFHFSKVRIGGIPSMFFAKVLKEESKKQLLKWIDECFVYES